MLKSIQVLAIVGIVATVVLASLVTVPQVKGADLFSAYYASLENPLRHCNWDLTPLRNRPYRLIDARYDVRQNEVVAEIGLTRDLTAAEQRSWNSSTHSPLAFYLIDSEGAVLKIIRAEKQGHIPCFGKQGSSVELVLPMPSDGTLYSTDEIVVKEMVSRPLLTIPPFKVLFRR